MSKYHPRYSPDNGRADEIARANELAAHRPEIFPHRQTLHVLHQKRVYRVDWTGVGWQCSCHYGRTHQPDDDPCCELRALDRWTQTAQIPFPRLMVLDETLFTHGRTTFKPDSGQHTAYRIVADIWREMAQFYATGQYNWSTYQIEGWYALMTACLICPDSRPIKAHRGSLRVIFDALRLELPNWFDAVYEIKKNLVNFLKQDGWESNLARKDAFCDGLDDRAEEIDKEWVRGRIRLIGDIIRYDRWASFRLPLVVAPALRSPVLAEQVVT